MQTLIDYYSNNDEEGRLLSKHGSVEFLTTMRYIDKYIKPGDKVLEIGAGTGRYSHALARQGYEVDALELVEYHIDIFKKNTQPNEKITIRQGNALDLSDFADNKYDITLLLGPMYHLYTKEDKITAINEAIRVTKQNGVIFIAYCISDPTILMEFFRNTKFNIYEYIEQGMIDPNTFSTKSEPKDLFELVRKEHIDDLMSGINATRLHYVATDGYTHHMNEAINEMDENLFDMYLKYHFATCEREDMVGLSHHVIDVLRKK